MQISLKSVSKDLFDNESVLVQVMAWWQTGDKPLSGRMMTQLWRIYAALRGDELTCFVLNCFEDILKYICIFYDIATLKWHQ